MTELSLKKSFFEWPFKNPAGWLVASIYGLLLMAIYYSTFNWLITQDWAREDFSYGYLIPFIVIYLVWDKRARLKELENRASWMGLLPLGVGVAFYWIGELGGEFFSLYMSFWLILVGVCWLHLGWSKLRVLAFPLIMTFTMFPLPSFLYNKVTLQLKLISSKLGVDMMQLFGMSAFREGNVIDLGFTQLQVVDACSGLRFAIPLLILSLLMAYLYRAPLWKRAILVISSIPLAIVTNALRIALTGLFYEIWGQEVAEGFFHTFSGWVIFISSIVVLLLEILILSLIPPRGSRRVNKIEAGKGREENHLREEHEITTRPETTFNKALWSHIKSTQFVVIIILLGFTLVLSRGINYREQIPIAKSFVDFPLEIGQWKGSRQILEQNIIEELDFTDYVMIDYRKADRKEINFYVAYYETQSKGASIHSPASCLPGSGWSFDEDGVISISMPEMHEGSMTVSRAYMTKGDAQQLVYYWFPQRDRILTNLYQLKIYAFWDALTRQRTDGSLVRLITPIYKKENIKGAEERLKAFIREILPVLNEYLPSAEL